MELFSETRKFVRNTKKFRQIERERPERVARLIEKGLPAKMLEFSTNGGLLNLEHQYAGHERVRGASVYDPATGELFVGKYDMPDAEDEPADTTFVEE